jgi:DNA-binding protein H-NS
LAFEGRAEVLEQLNRVFVDARESRAAQLLSELKRLGIKAGESAGQVFSKGRQSKLAGRRAEPKYRSRNDPSLTWAGRGQMPRWMRDEMKGTKLKKEDFAI